eukprot:SAG11_NODE_294_length_11142_cov_7.050439_1_plen_72_part_00
MRGETGKARRERKAETREERHRGSAAVGPAASPPPTTALPCAARPARSLCRCCHRDTPPRASFLRVFASIF